MHNVDKPHCSYCWHFESCFRTDRNTEWGYCKKKLPKGVPSLAAIDKLKAARSSPKFNERTAKLGLFVAGYTECESFDDSQF